MLKLFAAALMGGFFLLSVPAQANWFEVAFLQVPVDFPTGLLKVHGSGGDGPGDDEGSGEGGDPGDGDPGDSGGDPGGDPGGTGDGDADSGDEDGDDMEGPESPQDADVGCMLLPRLC